jgi:hypothetical protein
MGSSSSRRLRNPGPLLRGPGPAARRVKGAATEAITQVDPAWHEALDAVAADAGNMNAALYPYILTWRQRLLGPRTREGRALARVESGSLPDRRHSASG